MRWGLIGCGDIARKRVVPALQSLAGSDLLAVSRADAARAEAFAEEFGIPRWYSSWRELVQDPDLDAIYIATPVSVHAEQTIAAANTGKHVLCEKPMALSVNECDQMIAAGQANGIRLSVAYYRRFYPVLARMKQLIADGEIGRPVLAQVNAFEWFDPGPEDPRRWLLHKASSGGGPMFDFGCHRIELLLDLFGAIRDVRSALSNGQFEREVEDTATALLSFELGVQATLSVTHAAREPQDTLDIFGTAGSLHIGSLNSGGLTIVTAAGERVEQHSPHANFHQPLIEDFIRAIEERREPQVDGAAGREVNRILELIYQPAIEFVN